MTTLTVNMTVAGIADTTPPTLSALLASKLGSTGWTAVVDTNEADGSLLYVVSQNATENEATVLAGTSQTVEQSGQQTISGSGLSPSTTYRLHTLHRDAAGNSSPVLSSDEFTTDAASGLPDQSLPTVQEFHNGWPDISFGDPIITNVVDFGGATVNPNTLTITSGTEYRNGTFSQLLSVNGGDPSFNNVAFKNITFMDGFGIFDRGQDVLFEDCLFLANNPGQEGGVTQRVNGETPRRWRFRLCRLWDVYRPEQAGNWGTNDVAARENRTSGLFLSDIDGLHFVECAFDLVGWEPGYNLGGGPGKQPPSRYSHCLYIQRNCTNVGVERCIFSRAASAGVQVRPGGIIRDNIAVDCNLSLTAKMANEGTNPPGANANQTYMTRNLVVNGSTKPQGYSPVGDEGGVVYLEATGLVYTGNIRINCVAPKTPVTPLQFDADTVLATDLSSILSPANIRADHRAAWAAARAAVGL
jgi:hypothetical protein